MAIVSFKHRRRKGLVEVLFNPSKVPCIGIGGRGFIDVILLQTGRVDEQLHTEDQALDAKICVKESQIPGTPNQNQFILPLLSLLFIKGYLTLVYAIKNVSGWLIVDLKQICLPNAEVYLSRLLVSSSFPLVLISQSFTNVAFIQATAAHGYDVNFPVWTIAIAIAIAITIGS
ncbi:Uncharacterized protein TCM_000055 [Theobroma cacao]|uniref:Uncharacterized protein n=1 Tax=Theobroma cacao TaxID=3641 RepID=A0A061DF28_THECC|nr:Uncharacterized protein TCM_000055 [Theobroma cacao]